MKFVTTALFTPPLVALSESYHCTGTVAQSRRLLKDHSLCTLSKENESLGQIDVWTRDGEITDFYADGKFCDICDLSGSPENGNLVLVLDGQVYINTAAYSGLLSTLNESLTV